MVIVHGTKRFRDRVRDAGATVDDESSTLLGSWYADLLRWRPSTVLLVNATTLLPVLMPLGPASSALTRLASAVAEVLAAHRAPAEFIDTETAQMGTQRLLPTANRSLVGMLVEFAYLANAWRDYQDDLTGLSVRLAATPCSPLYQRHVSPDRELAAMIERWDAGRS